MIGAKVVKFFRKTKNVEIFSRQGVFFSTNFEKHAWPYCSSVLNERRDPKTSSNLHLKRARDQEEEVNNFLDTKDSNTQQKEPKKELSNDSNSSSNSGQVQQENYSKAIFEHNMMASITLRVKTSGGKSLDVVVEPHQTVGQLKVKLAELEGLPVAQQKVTLRGKALEDDKQLIDYELGDKALLMLIRVPNFGGPATAGATPSGGNSANNSTPASPALGAKPAAAAAVPPAERKLCVGNCGFFGSADTDDMCSKCYKEKAVRKRKEAQEAAEKAKKKTEDEDAAASGTNHVVEQTDFEKCWICSKKIGLLGFSCRCGYKFCGLHRYAEQHNCAVDFKKVDRKKLEAHNPKIENEKLKRI